MPFQLLSEFPVHTANNACCACKSDRRPTAMRHEIGTLRQEKARLELIAEAVDQAIHA